MLFTDCVACIVGGASGIGLAVETQIASERGRVALWDLDAGRSEAARTQSGASSVDVVNVTDASSADAAHAATVENLLHGERVVQFHDRCGVRRLRGTSPLLMKPRSASTHRRRMTTSVGIRVSAGRPVRSDQATTRVC
jgi:hypothetical protein